jgi:pimeloyl-ACP methyl ester carboxylesterase
MSELVTADGVRITYEVRGTGEPLYVCHGGPANVAATLVGQLRPLEDRFSLVYHDYRGSGSSATAPDHTYRFEQFSDDLDDLRRHLGHQQISVLAHSMGGFVALNYARRHPENCRRLVLVAVTPSGVPGKIALPALRVLGGPRLAKLLGRAVWYLAAWSWRRETLARRKARYAIMATTQEALPHHRDRIEAALGSLPADNDNVAALERLFTSIDLTPYLASIECPVLVVFGHRDAVMVAGGRWLAEGLKDVEVHVLPDVGHEVFLEAPEAVFSMIRAFVDRTV